MSKYRRMRFDPIDIKLLILYLIKQADRPLTATEITDIVLADSLLDFFETHQYISALLSEKQIEEIETNTYQLTEEGNQAIEFFENRLPYSVLETIKNKMKTIQKQEQFDQLVTADYLPLKGEEVQIHLTLRETSETVPFEIKFTVTGQETAKDICKGWKENYAQTFLQITDVLSKL